MKKVTESERFWKKVNKNGPTPEHDPSLGPCWNWTAATNGHGYGRFWVDGRLVQAHRYALGLTAKHTEGSPEPDHLCRNRACVRPKHLEVVTRRTNLRRIPMYSHNTSGVKGVGWDKKSGRWKAYARDNTGRMRHVGYFSSRDEAEVHVVRFREQLAKVEEEDEDE